MALCKSIQFETMHFERTLALSCFLLLHGIWWLIMCINNYFMSKIPDRATRRKPQFISKTWHPVPCCLKKCPLEPMLKIIIALVCAAIELSVSKSWKLFHDDKVIFSNNIFSFQHATLFVMFAVLGVAEIFVSIRKIQLPHQIPHMILSLIFMTIGLVYFFDTNGKNSSHAARNHAILLSFIAVATSFVTAIESCHTKSFPLSLSRCYLTVLQGTWLLQMAFSIYGAKPWKIVQQNAPFVPLTLLWHILGLICVCIIFHGVMLYAFNRYKKAQDTLYNGLNNHRKVNEDSIPLGIVVNGNMLYDGASSDEDESLYP